MTLSLLRRLHRWIGLAVALPVAVQGLTGAILAFAPLASDLVSLPPGTPRPASAIVAAARESAGPQARALRYEAPAGPGQPARVQVAEPGSPPRTLRVDPASLAVLDAGSAGEDALRWLRSLHVQFLAAEYGGRGIGGWFGVGLLALLATGVPIWWPRAGDWKSGFTIDPRARGFRFHRRLHGALGAWSLAVLAVLAGTGVALAFPRTTRGLLGLEAGGPPRALRLAAPAPGAPDIDRALALAGEAAPGATLRMVVLPNRPEEATRIFLLHPGGEGATGSITVQVDPAAGRVLEVKDARAQPAADRAYRWMHDLHEGAGLGPAWRVLSGLGGLALPVFAVTGVLMWWLRSRARRRVRPVGAPATETTARP